MNELSKLLQENLNIEFISATLSNPKKKDDVQKVKVRPVLKKEVLYFQFESFRNNQAFHENVEEKKACEILLEYMGNMRQMQMETQRADYTVLVSKKGKVTIKSKIKKGGKKKIDMSHDRKKKYVLEEYDIRIIGLDLKKEVIRHCNELSEKYGYEKLRFLEGDIADYTGVNKVDMVVTLHACDTATDYALAKAVGWDAKVILSVPCCQHELNRQIRNEVLEPVLRYGLLKERMAALITDGLRAQYLEREGYEAQILEFIDMEHTPKNILIRAVKRNQKADQKESVRRQQIEASIRKCEAELRVSPTLGHLLDNQGKTE